MKRRTYMGYNIMPSAYAGFRWYVARIRPTGVPMCEALCPRFGSLKAAEQHIRDEVMFEAAKGNEL